MKKYLKTLILSSVVVLIPVLAGLILWQFLPQEVPSHWNAQGEVDGWSSRAFTVFGLPLILLAVQWFMAFVILADPKNRNISDPILKLTFWLIPFLSLMVNTAVYLTALGVKVPMERIAPIFIGILFIALGIYMPRCKQNYTVGFKLPWTLHSEENWNRTHRFAGPLWVIAGVLAVVLGVLGFVIPMLVVVILSALAPMVYSYLLYRKGI